MTTVTETTDAPSDTVTRYSIEVGDTFLGEFSFYNDTDWIRTTLPGSDGYGYYASLQGDVWQLNLTLWSEAGGLHTVSESTGTVAMALLTPTTDTTYYLDAQSYLPQETGGYQLEMFREVRNDISTNAHLVVGDTITSAIDYLGDVDFFRITLEGGKGYYATMQGDGSAAQIPTNVQLFLRDATGDFITADGDTSGDGDFIEGDVANSALVAVNPTTDTTYYLDATGHYGNGGYELALVEEVGSGITTLENIAFGTQNSPAPATMGAIDYAGDADWFRVTLTQGYSYYATLSGDGSADALDIGEIMWRDATGEIANPGSGRPPLDVFTPEADGPYYIDAQGQFDFTGSYALQVLQETAGGISTSARLTLGQAMANTLDYEGDLDAFRIALTAGETYTFALTGDGGAQSLDQGYLQFVDATSKAIGNRHFDRDGPLETTFVPDETGTYFVQVGGTNGTGDYVLSAFVRTTLPSGDVGDNTIIGTPDNELINGFGGNDYIVGAGGRDWLIGGDGYDVMFGDGAAAGYHHAAGQLFSSNPANVAYRLYLATLDREPDVGGHEAWSWRLASGELSAREVAERFVASPEFQQTYANLTDVDFVTLLYNNVLDRTPDAAGLARWTGELAGGASRADVVLGFSESPQFRIETEAAADAYVVRTLPTTWSDEVFRLYQATLDRVPDMMGQTNWAERLASGERSLLEVAEGFVGSPEFQATYANLSDTEFVTLLYSNVLGTDTPDDAGLARWTGELADGASRAEVVLGFSQSPQFTAQTQADLKNWMREQGIHDRIDPGLDNNLVAGGQFADAFEFTPNPVSTGVVPVTLVADLEPWDYLDFTSFGYDSVAEVQDAMQQSNSRVAFLDQNTLIYFNNTTLGLITDDMILI
jgi:hypothetical protein